MEDRRKGDHREQNLDHLLSDEQVGQLAGVPSLTVKYWRHTGKLPYVKVGKHPRIWYSEFLKVFKKPLPILGGEAGKMGKAEDIRRIYG